MIRPPAACLFVGFSYPLRDGIIILFSFTAGCQEDLILDSQPDYYQGHHTSPVMLAATGLSCRVSAGDLYRQQFELQRRRVAAGDLTAMRPAVCAAYAADVLGQISPSALQHMKRSLLLFNKYRERQVPYLTSYSPE